MNEVVKLNPEYNPRDFALQTAAEKEFNIGKNGNKTRSLNVAVSHLTTLDTAAVALRANDVRAFNEFKQAWQRETGKSAPTDFNAVRELVADEIVAAVGAPNLKVQMDLYHCQIVEGDVAMKIRQYLPTGQVGHFQIAGVPERHEPDIGELNYAYLFKVIDEVSAACGWQGWVGCEYRPQKGGQPGGTSAGMGWLRA
jgi:hydroxypyruvate isomerase